ncbi:DUF6603 domain-containing protein [Dactylosporangium cerinum]
MGGGTLDLAFRSGALGAWLRAYADFLMYWRPFSFDIRIGVAVGVSYTLAIGSIRRTFTAELSADIELWGPSLAGVAHVRWWIISFTIPINGGVRPPRRPGVLDSWQLFADSFLPAAADVCRPRVDAGLLGAVRSGEHEVSLVAAVQLRLGAESAVPATEVEVEGPPGREVHLHGNAFGVYPLGSLTVSSRLTLALHRDDGDLVDLHDWAWTTHEQGLPYALWGTVNTGVPGRDSPLVDGLVGISGSPPPPAEPGALDVAWTALTAAGLRPGVLPLPRRTPINGTTPPPDRDPRDVVAATVADPHVVARRAAVVDALLASGVGRGLRTGPMTGLAAQVDRTFPAPPMLGPLGTTGPPPVPASPPRPQPRPGPARRRPAVPPVRLVALLHRRRAGSYAHVRSTRGGRAVLDLLGAAPRLGAGTSALWRVTPDAGHTLHADGPVPVDVLALDAHGNLVHRARLTGEHCRLPAGTTVVYAAADPPATALRPGTTLFAALPQAWLAPGLLLRPQAPCPAPSGRHTLAQLRERNLVETATGPAPGWLGVTLLTPATAVQLPAGSGPTDVYLVDGDHRRLLHPDRDTGGRVYRLPGTPGPLGTVLQLAPAPTGLTVVHDAEPGPVATGTTKVVVS